MKKIGEGWQYSIYDLGNGRVFKKFHSRLRSYWVILKNIFPFRDHSFTVIPGFSRSVRKKALASFKIIKSKKYLIHGLAIQYFRMVLIMSRT